MSYTAQLKRIQCQVYHFSARFDNIYDEIMDFMLDIAIIHAVFGEEKSVPGLPQVRHGKQNAPTHYNAPGRQDGRCRNNVRVQRKYDQFTV